jgi:O-6-methylguanine DNA methyltransferase
VPTLYRSFLERPEWSLVLFSTEIALVGIALGREGERALLSWLLRAFGESPVEDAGSRHGVYARQLVEFFDGKRRVFDFPMELRGSDFQKDVWRAVENVPYGRTATYGEIAHVIGRPKASRAVGAANGANPIPIVIPCHRILGSNGSLTGYGGGLPMKRRLLALEGSLRAPVVQMRLL